MQHIIRCLPVLNRALLIALLISTYEAAGQQTVAPDQTQANLQSFDQVWTTVRDKHWDKTLGGVDWSAVRAEFRPRMVQASNRQEARAILREMLARLMSSHFNVHAPDEDEDSDSSAAEAGRDGSCGFDVRVLDGQALVTSVTSGCGAERLGLHTGWRIVSINGAELKTSLEHVAKEYRSSPMRDYELAWVVMKHLSGKPEQKVSIDFLDGEDRQVNLAIPFCQRPGHKYTLPNMPPRYVYLEFHSVGPHIGYIRLNTWADPTYVVERLLLALRTTDDTDGLVIDLRGNRGGHIQLAQAVAGFFIKDEGKILGSLTFRDKRVECKIPRQSVHFDGSLAILVDGLSRSTTEMFTSGLQNLGRAHVFGARTAGRALSSVVDRLPNGDSFQYAIADFETSKGESLEGVGVTPDVVVVPTRSELLAGRDPVMEKALEWIRNPNTMKPSRH